MRGMILVGITGAQEHGKSTLAEAFIVSEPSAQHDASSWVVSEFASEAKKTLPLTQNLTAVNEWLSSLTPLIHDQLAISATSDKLLISKHQVETYPSGFRRLWEYIELMQEHPHLLEEVINEANKPFHRPILQWFGGFFVERLKPTIWYDQLIKRAKKAEQAGCALYAISGLRYPADAEVIRQADGTVLEIIRPGYPVPDTDDPTEIQRRLITVESTVVNDGSIPDLQHVAERLLGDLKATDLQKRYRAKNS